MRRKLKMANKGKNLREFLQKEIEKRKLSATAFAEQIGVAPSTITGYINGKRDTVPTLDVLRRIAHGTGTPLSVILTLAFPELTEELRVDPRAALLVQAIMKLPQPVQDFLETVIEGYEQNGGGDETG